MSYYYSDTEAIKHYHNNQFTLTPFTLNLLHPIKPGENQQEHDDKIRGYFKIYSDYYNSIVNGKRYIQKLPESYLEREYEDRRAIDRYFKEIAQNEREKPPLISLPGHKFLGPGNSLSGQAPLDEDDANSERHDIAYSKAETQGDIEKADKEFIHDAVSDVLETGNPHSILGALGVGIKAAAEKVVGPIYPGNVARTNFSFERQEIVSERGTKRKRESSISE